MYGAPPTLGALVACVAARVRERCWRDYMAHTAWVIGRRVYMPMEYPVASWMELTAEKGERDTRSGREILDEIRQKMRKRVTAHEAV